MFLDFDTCSVMSSSPNTYVDPNELYRRYLIKKDRRAEPIRVREASEKGIPIGKCWQCGAEGPMGDRHDNCTKWWIGTFR